MSRTVPVDRIPRLVECATQTFIANGYAQTRMEDVAEALGVAKGTVYLYVESKEALFDLVMRAADRPDHVPELPVKTPRSGTTVAFIGKRLADEHALPMLTSALARNIELAEVVELMFDLLHRHRTAIKLLDRAARDIPELSRAWSGGARRQLIEAVARYLQRGIRDGLVRDVPDAAIAARFVVETCAFWAVHRHWDAVRIEVPEDKVRASVIDLVVGALVAKRKEQRS